MICISCNKKEFIEFEDIGEGKYCQDCLDREMEILSQSMTFKRGKKNGTRKQVGKRTCNTGI